MFKSKLADENRHVHRDLVCKSRHLRKSAWAVLHHSPHPQPTSLNLRSITFGQETMRLQRATTTTTAPRVQTTMHQVNRRIYHAQTAVQQRPQSGVEISEAKWFVTLADCTSNCTVSIGHIQCAVTRFTPEDVVQRAINRIEEVSK